MSGRWIFSGDCAKIRKIDGQEVKVREEKPGRLYCREVGIVVALGKGKMELIQGYTEAGMDNVWFEWPEGHEHQTKWGFIERMSASARIVLIEE